MSVDVTLLVGREEVTAIATDVWASLVGFDEHLTPLAQPQAHLPLDALSAWVLVVGPWSGSLVLTCAPATAAALTRAVLRADDDEELTEEDVADALGEVANVIGGNVKALLVEPSSLGLPQVGPGMEAPAGHVVLQLDLAWRGQPVLLSLRSAATAPPTSKELL